jgi:hypothetical protein
MLKSWSFSLTLRSGFGSGKCWPSSSPSSEVSSISQRGDAPSLLLHRLNDLNLRMLLLSPNQWLRGVRSHRREFPRGTNSYCILHIESMYWIIFTVSPTVVIYYYPKIILCPVLEEFAYGNLKLPFPILTMNLLSAWGLRSLWNEGLSRRKIKKQGRTEKVNNQHHVAWIKREVPDTCWSQTRWMSHGNTPLHLKAVKCSY